MGLRYWWWKQKTRKIPPQECATCCACDDPIYPGEFVGETTDGRLVHAGYHYSLTRGETAFCETAAIGSGFWDGKQVVGRVESAGSKAMRTGTMAERSVGPSGIIDR
jgi:hypothetical protein